MWRIALVAVAIFLIAFVTANLDVPIRLFVATVAYVCLVLFMKVVNHAKK